MGDYLLQHWAIPDIHVCCQAFDEYHSIAFKLFPFQNCGVGIVQMIDKCYRSGMKITISTTCKSSQKWIIKFCVFNKCQMFFLL